MTLPVRAPVDHPDGSALHDVARHICGEVIARGVGAPQGHLCEQGSDGRAESGAVPHPAWATIERLRQQLAVSDALELRGFVFPLLAPLLRRAVREVLTDMRQRGTEARTHAWTWRWFPWVWEALRTARPLADVVCDHSLVYRVQHVFLIHRETGLLLQDVSDPQAPPSVRTPDVVCGMLSAIQDFVRDSFATMDGDTLDTLRTGELTVWVEHGAIVSIAAVVYGFPPEAEVRRVLLHAVDRIQCNHADALAAFAGDVAPFAAVRGHLASCLLSLD